MSAPPKPWRRTRFLLIILGAAAFTWQFPVLFELAVVAIVGGAFWLFT